MSVIVVQVFVSLTLVAGSLVLFLHSVRQRDFEHADRLALAPLDDDSGARQPDAAPERAAHPDHEATEARETSETANQTK